MAAPPEPSDDRFELESGQAINGSVAGNDSDPDGDVLTFRQVTGVNRGSLEFRGDGSFIYVNDGSGDDDGEIEDGFVYAASDPDGEEGLASVLFVIRSDDDDDENEPPIARDDRFNVDQGGTLSASVAANDEDPDGDRLTFELINTPRDGTVSFSSDGSFVYVHNGGDRDEDQFRYRVLDGNGRQDTASVEIAVIPGNSPPVALPDSFSVEQGGTVSGSVTANDSDPDGDPLTFELILGPTSGSLDFRSDGSFSYTHNGSDTTEDSFRYRANDGRGGRDGATVRFTIAPDNAPPIARDDRFSLDQGGTLSASVAGNDEDPDGDPLSFELTQAPASGSLEFNGNGTFTYVHDGSDSSEDAFRYRVSDGQGGQDTAAVNLSITPGNDPPVAANDAISVSEGGETAGNVLDNDSDPDGDPLSVRLVDDVDHGVLALAADGSFTYRHDGGESEADSFVYEVSDGEATDRATVAITIRGVNDIPVARDDAYTLDEGETITRDVTDNDTDPDDPNPEVRLVEGVSNGVLDLQASGRFTYTHDGSETTDDRFVYEIRDSEGATDQATVTFTITSVNDPPTITGLAPGVVLSTTEDSPLALVITDFEVSDTETPDPADLLLEVKPGADYAVSGNVLTPAEDFNGVLTVGVAVSDGESTSDPVSVEVTVTAVNDAPTVTGQRPLETAEDEPLNLVPADLVFEDPDNSNPADFVVNVLAGENYTALGSRVTPNPDFNGELSVPVQVSDGTDPSEPFSVTLVVSPVNDAPRVDRGAPGPSGRRRQSGPHRDGPRLHRRGRRRHAVLCRRRAAGKRQPGDQRAKRHDQRHAGPRGRRGYTLPGHDHRHRRRRRLGERHLPADRRRQGPGQPEPRHRGQPVAGRAR